jgi:hypothetical protein
MIRDREEECTNSFASDQLESTRICRSDISDEIVETRQRMLRIRNAGNGIKSRRKRPHAADLRDGHLR